MNNVETFANVPVIVLKGAEWFASIGTEKSKGTKVFALAENQQRGPHRGTDGYHASGDYLRDRGRCERGKNSRLFRQEDHRGCLTEKHLDTPIDYESLMAAGSMMGSGGMIVLDEDDCMVSVAKFYLGFIVEESCGRCAPCRIGSKRLYETLDRITAVKGSRRISRY